jgi:hypothetical protein
MGWLEKDSRVALYLATRHFAGWFLYNVLELPAEDVAIQLGMRTAASWSACCTGIGIGRGRWLGLSVRSRRVRLRMWLSGR